MSIYTVPAVPEFIYALYLALITSPGSTSKVLPSTTITFALSPNLAILVEFQVTGLEGFSKVKFVPCLRVQ